MTEYRLGLYEKAMPKELSWQEKLRLCKENGFDYLEMSIDETEEKIARLDWDAEMIATLKQEMVAQDTPIASICLSAHRKYPLGSLDYTTQATSLTIAKKAVDLAEKLGIRMIQLAGYDVYYEKGSTETKACFQKNLRKCVDMAAQKGVLLGFETMETPFMDTVEKAMEYVTEINSPYLHVYPDIGNLNNASLLYHSSLQKDLSHGVGHMIASHLKETEPGKYRDMLFGTGKVNFEQAVTTLREMNVRMFVAEFWYLGNKDWQTDLKKSATFLRSYLDKAFTK